MVDLSKMLKNQGTGFSPDSIDGIKKSLMNTVTSSFDESDDDMPSFTKPDLIGSLKPKVLYQEYLNLKSSVSCVEISLDAIKNDIRKTRSIVETQNAKFESRLNRIEAGFENKLAVFMSALSIDCEDKIDKRILNNRDEMNSFRASISNLESKIRETKEDVAMKSELFEEVPTMTDIDAIKKDLTKSKQNTANEIEKLRQESENKESKFQVLHDLLGRSQASLIEKIESDIEGIQINLSNVQTELAVNTEKVNNLFEKDEEEARKEITTVKTTDKENADNTSVDTCTKTSSSKLKLPFTSSSVDDTKLLICMDSNRRYLNTKMFWKPQGTTWKSCSTLQQVKKNIKKGTFNNLEAVLISCGVDDLDSKSGADVADELVRLVNRIKLKYPSANVIVSEITPRNDIRDQEVYKCNEVLNATLREMPSVFLVEQSNLRDGTWSMYHDTKHVKKSCIATFASNLKKGIRMSYGTELPQNMVKKRVSQIFQHDSNGNTRVYRKYVKSYCEEDSS